MDDDGLEVTAVAAHPRPRARVALRAQRRPGRPARQPGPQPGRGALRRGRLRQPQRPPSASGCSPAWGRWSPPPPTTSAPSCATVASPPTGCGAASPAPCAPPGPARRRAPSRGAVERRLQAKRRQSGPQARAPVPSRRRVTPRGEVRPGTPAAGSLASAPCASRFKTSPQNTTWSAMLDVWRAADHIELYESGLELRPLLPDLLGPGGPLPGGVDHPHRVWPRPPSGSASACWSPACPTGTRR